MADQHVLVLGAGGMLGHKMFQTLRESFPGTVGTVRSLPPEVADFTFLMGRDVMRGVDAFNLDELRTCLQSLKPSVIVNCVGIIKQRTEANASIPSITINSLLPHKLAEYASGWGGRVIHFSTDCVFNGKKGGYTEEDTSDAEDLYGRSKYLGEVAAPNAITLRTSMIGRELTRPPRALLDWFLLHNHGTVRGFQRAIYSGVTTNYLADITARVISDHSALSGLYQVASNPTSKYDLLCLVKNAYGLDIEVEAVAGESCDRSMRANKFHNATGYLTPDWPDLLEQLAKDKTPYRRF